MMQKWLILAFRLFSNTVRNFRNAPSEVTLLCKFYTNNMCIG